METLESFGPVNDTISGLLYAQRSEKPGLRAPNRRPLSLAGLSNQVEQTITAINRLGIGHNDTVALILPNGPEMATAFLGIAAGASAAPINPALPDTDFRFYLSDLGAKALFVKRNSDSSAVAVAKSLGIPIMELAWSDEDPAGTFSIVGDPVGPIKTEGPAGAEDIALVLHTSGTTSGPKMVPLSQRNLLASANHIVQTLNLSPEDRSLNVMPLFHIHGLIAGVLSSLAAGGSVFCTPRFQALKFYQWMAEAMPTWYSAVPTIHQSVLAHAEQNHTIIDKVHLRFIRSSSAALPLAVMRELEKTFNAPVIESYGMTEAAHQMASNPLPPGVRKPGTVGPAAGPEIAVMDSTLKILPAGATGEVVIRGPNVTAGYSNNPKANESAFTNGWFHTGDEGRLDEDGYLTITGRLKEIIIRGGQKISPREIDDILMDHPDVEAVATFPIFHPTLGEEIAVAVVAKKGTFLTEIALVSFLRSRLADFKIPRRILFIEEIPKGATGKIQRHELAGLLGVSGIVESTRVSVHTDNRTPTPLEKILIPLWERVLGLKETIGLDENFFLLGGDSLQAVELLILVEASLKRSLPPSILLETSTVSEMARFLEKDIEVACAVPIRPEGKLPPFFCVHDRSGRVLFLRRLAQYMREDQPIYGIRSARLDGKQSPFRTIEAMAAHYILEMQRYQPAGPYYLGGYSMGGVVAYEMTRQLKAAGEKVALLALIDTLFLIRKSLSQRSRDFFVGLFGMPHAGMGTYLGQKFANVTRLAAESVRRRLLKTRMYLFSLGGSMILKPLYPDLDEINKSAEVLYQMRPLDVDAVLIKGRLEPWQTRDVHDVWKDFILGNLEIREVSGHHRELMNEPYVEVVAAELTNCLMRRYSGSSDDSIG